MVVNKITPLLMRTGFSEYEARAYVALLGKNPASAYEVARSSGIPTSKIYEVISRLAEKGVVSVLDGKKGTKNYIPMEPSEFLEDLRSRTEATLEGLKGALSGASRGDPDVSCIWNISGYGHLMDKARRIISGAGETLLLSIWEEEAGALRDVLDEAGQRGVRIAAVYFGHAWTGPGMTYQHPIHDSIYAEKGGRGLSVVADSADALVGAIAPDGAVDGARSSNSGFVTFAEDYIRHDIYMMKVIKRFDRHLRERFGNKYEMLRDVFSDRDAP
jgi:predicted transcriptional regulator